VCLAGERTDKCEVALAITKAELVAKTEH